MDKGDTSVLLVEDEKLLNWSLVKCLTKWGCDVCPAFNGREAVEKLQKSDFDVIILDYQLPDLNGLELARHVRHILPSAVIILVTAFQLSELSLDEGLINAYFNKPLELEHLRRALKKVSKIREPKESAGGGSFSC